MTEERLAELEMFEQAATEGTWDDRGRDVYGLDRTRRDDMDCPVEVHVADTHSRDDAVLIAAARNALPELIAEVRRLREQRDRLWSEMLESGSRELAKDDQTTKNYSPLKLGNK